VYLKKTKIQPLSKLYQIVDAAKKYQVGTDALRYVMDNLEPTYLLSGASNIEQLEQNIKAYNFKLEREELKVLNSFKTDSRSTGKKEMSCLGIVFSLS
jgi:aryl-alcohol dehydrogenase-like predicted oxidoreductase